MPRPGDIDADAAFGRIAEQAAAGDLPGAGVGLVRLVSAADAAGDQLTAARALRLAAILARLTGDRDPVPLARRAVALATDAEHDGVLAGEATPLCVDAQDTLGQALMARGDRAAAGEAAAVFAHAAGLASSPERRTDLLRKRAYALLGVGDQAAAVELLERIAAEAEPGGDPAAALEALITAATVAAGTGAGRDAAGGADAGGAAARLYAAALAAAHRAGSPSALAELHLLAAARLVRAGDLTGARDAVRTARRHALTAVHPVAYLGAAVAESTICAELDDRPGAYASLATGYATLADLLGRPVSAASFAPHLRALRQRWGPAEFASVKTAYERLRRLPDSTEQR